MTLLFTLLGWFVGVVMGMAVVLKAFHDRGLYLDPTNDPNYKPLQKVP